MVGGMHIVDAPRTPMTRRGLISANTSLPAHPREAARRAAAPTDAPEKLKQRITGSLFSSRTSHSHGYLLGPEGGCGGGGPGDTAVDRPARPHARRRSSMRDTNDSVDVAHVKSVISNTSSLPSLRSSLRGPPPSISTRPPAARGATLRSSPILVKPIKISRRI